MRNLFIRTSTNCDLGRSEPTLEVAAVGIKAAGNSEEPCLTEVLAPRILDDPPLALFLALTPSHQSDGVEASVSSINMGIYPGIVTKEIIKYLGEEVS